MNSVNTSICVVMLQPVNNMGNQQGFLICSVYIRLLQYSIYMCSNMEFILKGSETMKMEQYIRAIAGIFILVSLALGYLVSPYWLFFTAFVGANLLQSAFTGWCPMELFLNKLGVKR